MSGEASLASAMTAAPSSDAGARRPMRRRLTAWLFAPVAQISELSEARRAFYIRLAFAVATLSIVFEKVFDAPENLAVDRPDLVAVTALFIAATAFVIPARTSRLGVALLAAGLFYYLIWRWPAYHNHGWLTVWTMPVALLFGAQWWASDLYRWYLRATLGVVMLGACAQKLLAGTYLDGSFITYLSLYGARTETMFGYLCGPDMAAAGCFWHRFLGTFIVVWQAIVGVLLIAGLRSLAFLIVEIAFLLGAGLYADEMNFQVLNIALLAIAFGYGMRPWLLVLCLVFLAIDVASISALIDPFVPELNVDP